MKYLVILLALSCFEPSVFHGQSEPRAQKYQPTADAVKKLEANFVPAKARPGETITLKIELQIKDGFDTFPTRQPGEADKKMAFWKNKIVFPKESVVSFSGEIKEPPKPIVRSEPLLDIKEYHTYRDTATWECKAVVSPDAKPGKITVKIRFVLLVANERISHYPHAFDLEASVEVQGTPIEKK